MSKFLTIDRAKVSNDAETANVRLSAAFSCEAR